MIKKQVLTTLGAIAVRGGWLGGLTKGEEGTLAAAFKDWISHSCGKILILNLSLYT